MNEFLRTWLHNVSYHSHLTAECFWQRTQDNEGYHALPVRQLIKEVAGYEVLREATAVEKKTREAEQKLCRKRHQYRQEHCCTTIMEDNSKNPRSYGAK